MGRIAIIIAVGYGVLGLLVVALIAGVVWSSTLGRNHQVDTRKLSEREKTWFGIVVFVLVGLLFGTIFFTPYGRGAGADGAQVVPVTAQQFAFVVPQTTLHVGKPVAFKLTSKDVSHGFAVFDPQHTFLFQVQVTPGKTQWYRWTFSKPGTYTIECFEYCGVGHDQMGGQFTVVR